MSLRVIQKTKDKLARSIQQLIGYAKISSSSAKQDLSATITDGEVAEKLPYFQDYGFKSRPKGGIAITVSVGGNRDDQAIVGILPEGPDDLEEGEVAIYIDDGDEIRITKDEIKIKSKTVKIEGDLKVTGEVTANYKDAKTTLSKHIHPTAVPGPASTPTPGT